MATRIDWTEAERALVIAEGIRLQRSGIDTSQRREMLRRAQEVLPSKRRRLPVNSTLAAAPWFWRALEAAQKPPGAPRSDDQGSGATFPQAQDSEALRGRPPGRTSGTRIVWKDREKRELCATAARLMFDLQAGGPREALEKAQTLVLPPERQRVIFSMSNVADWFHPGLQAERELLSNERAALARIKQAEEAAAAAKPVEAPAAPAPAPAPAPGTQPEPVQPVATLEPVRQAAQVPAPVPALTSMFGGWPTLREHLVQEIASIVAEGIQRGLASVQLAAPADSEATGAGAMPQHRPFVADLNPKTRPPSVLVVGLKGGQIPQIKADFGARLDLRFCGVDESKDQLRSMTEQADTTVTFADFISHSHRDICKARSRHLVESLGGMTSLRQHLAQLAGLQTNGAGHAAN